MNKKKIIGIITFHRSYNSGSILQAYALQNVIKNKLGLENEIIDFSNSGQKRYYSIIVEIKKFKDIIRNIVYGIFYIPLKRHNTDYENYIIKNLILSEQKYNEFEQLKNIEDRYSILICGSDQVWNTKCADADDAYFLAFAERTPKIAYATSMGANNIVGSDASTEKHYRNLLKNFKSISVREFNAQKWLSKLYDRDIKITADPTLLLSREEWEKLCLERIYKGEYIFYYSFGYDREYSKTVYKISQKLNLPVIVMDSKSWVKMHLFTYGFKLSKNSGPAVFLTLIRDAKLVLTTSLHGTIFSTIFNKHFWYLKKDGFEINDNIDDRAISLLTQLGLMNRYISCTDLINKELLEEIDYDEVNKCVRPLIDMSIQYLDENLKSY